MPSSGSDERRPTVPRIEWWTAIRGSSLPPLARLLALTMATYMDPDGTRCWPGQDALAAACGWSDGRSVRQHLKVLEREGFVDVERFAGPRRDGRAQATHRYRPTLPKPDQPERAFQENDETNRNERSGRTATNRSAGATKRNAGADQPEPEGPQPPQDLPKDLPTRAADAPETNGHAQVERGGEGSDAQLRDLAERLGLDLGAVTERLRDAWAKLEAAGWTVDELAVDPRLARTLPEKTERPAALLAYRLEEVVGSFPPAVARERRRAAELDAAEARGYERAHLSADEDEALTDARGLYPNDEEAQAAQVAGWHRSRNDVLVEASP